MVKSCIIIIIDPYRLARIKKDKNNTVFKKFQFVVSKNIYKNYIYLSKIKNCFKKHTFIKYAFLNRGFIWLESIFGDELQINLITLY